MNYSHQAVHQIPRCIMNPLSYGTFKTMVLKKAAQELDNSLKSEVRDDLY